MSNVPDEVYVVIFEDPEIEHMTFTGEGAKEAAEAYYAVALVNWNCWLMAPVAIIATLTEQLAEAKATIKRLDWREITPETVFDPSLWYSIAALGPIGEIWYSTIEGAQFQRPESARHLLEIKRTHFRPINPPTVAKETE